jgi:hypothetical protein
MKKSLVLLALALTITAAITFKSLNTTFAASDAPRASNGLALPNPDAMTVFTNKEGGFTVKLPGDPKPENQTIDTAAGPIVLHMFTLEANAGKFAYLVQFSDFPSIPDAAKAVDGAIDGQTKSFKGTLVSDKKVVLNGWPGRVVRINGEAVDCLSSAYVAGNRLYQVMFVMEKGQTAPPEATEFLNSFQITYKP